MNKPFETYQQVKDVLESLSISTLAKKKTLLFRQRIISPPLAGFWLSAPLIALAFFLASHDSYLWAISCVSGAGVLVVAGIVLGIIEASKKLAPNPTDILVRRADLEGEQIDLLLRHPHAALRMALTRVETQRDCLEIRTKATGLLPGLITSIGFIGSSLGATGVFTLLPLPNPGVAGIVNAMALVVVLMGFSVKFADVLSVFEIAKLREKEFYLSSAMKLIPENVRRARQAKRGGFRRNDTRANGEIVRQRSFPTTRRSSG